MMATISSSGPAAATTRSKAPADTAEPAPDSEPLISADSSLLRDVEVTLQARLGQVVMPISELMALRADSVLSLDSRLNEPIDLLLNDALVARGEIVAVDDMFGVRIVEIAAK
jgi:flagellar motor switch protein FliN/FliY